MGVKRATSSATPDPAEPGPVSDGSQMPADQWAAMQDILNAIYNFRTADGYDPSKAFHKKVNKRLVPGYYDIITEPIAMSTIKYRIQRREYSAFPAFVRDFALIFHNAQVYNRPDAGAYQDAVLLRQQLEQQLQKYVVFKTISADQAALPYLGEIPPQEDSPPAGADDDDDDDDEDDDDEDDDEEEDEPGDSQQQPEEAKKRRPGRPRLSGGAKSTPRSAGPKRERRRPPKIQTPTEARIQAVLKALRKPKSAQGFAKVINFERLPDKTVLPDYYQDIKNPMAYDILKRKFKRRKYSSLDQFMIDIDLMFDNAKLYNQDSSEIFRDAVELQAEAHRVADEERLKPDSEFVMEEGRIPMPEGILHNGEHFKVGDWVLIQNPNDLQKPIPSQIYRTFRDPMGANWVNVCWYYRPEQTVHRFDKHFFDNEIVKTGQYKDHRIDEIIGRCFVMFVTRYFKGRPKNLPQGVPVFISEARYNEDRCTFNKVKTWASCLPDEVRDKDYEMDMFSEPRRMKKYPSPLAHMLPADAKESDPLPKPEWGAKNAPPKLGAVHNRPRDPSRDSLPPEPTPPPAPKPPTPVVQQAPAAAAYPESRSNSAVAYSPRPTDTSNVPADVRQSVTQAASSTTRPTYPSSQSRSYGASSQSSGPGAQQQHSYPPQQQRSQTPATPQTTATSSARNPIQPVTTSYPSQAAQPRSSSYARPDQTSSKGPPPIETYTLPDAVDSAIPDPIRQRFQRDEAGRVLFFTAPPLCLTSSTPNESQPANTTAPSSRDANLSHTLRYTAAKMRKSAEIARRRADLVSQRARLRAERRAIAESDAAESGREKKLKTSSALLQDPWREVYRVLRDSLATALAGDLVALYGGESVVGALGWQSALDDDLDAISRL